MLPTCLLLATLLQSPEGEHLPTFFDRSGLPPRPTNFEEQKVEESLKFATSPALLAFAHRQLARYYAAKGRSELAAGEYLRAVLADPNDHRAYEGLSDMAESLGGVSGDGKVTLKEVASKLKARTGAVPSEPKPKLLTKDPRATAEFNRRMNTLYTSGAWQRMNRSLFPNLYGK